MPRYLNTILATLVLGTTGLAVQAQAATRPCEDVLKEYRTAKETAKVSADVMKQADELEAKAVERCNADDDKRSDAFLMDAMKLIGK